jgi:hypothetical protein
MKNKAIIPSGLRMKRHLRPLKRLTNTMNFFSGVEIMELNLTR